MITTILFVISSVIVVNYSFKMFSSCLGNSIFTPAPILCIWNISFANTYISSFGIGYQAYFWASHFGVI